MAYRAVSILLACALGVGATLREDEALVARIDGLENEWANARAASEKLMDPLPPNLWQDCDDLPVLDQTCIGLFWDEANLTIGVDLSISGAGGHNFTLYSVDAGQYCMSEKDLLKLIELIPPLLPYKPAIDKIVAELGKIPVGILSVCTELTDMDISKTDVKGKIHVHYQLMCLLGHCVASGDSPVHDFDLPIP